MNLYEEIRRELKQKIADGKTQEEISKQAGISRSHLCHLKNGSRSIGGMTLDTFFKLFPAATIKIHGDQVSAENSGINNGVMGINHGTVNAADAVAILDRYRLRIQDEIIRSDVDPESKIKVLNILLESTRQ